MTNGFHWNHSSNVSPILARKTLSTRYWGNFLTQKRQDDMTLSAQVNFYNVFLYLFLVLDSYCFCFVFVPATFIGIDVAFTSPWRPHTDGPSSFSISLHCDHFLFCAPPSLIFLEIVCFIIILLILPFLLWSSFPFIRNDRPCRCTKPGTNVGLAYLGIS